MPDLNYVPYSITGASYQLELLQASANYVIAAVSPYSEYYGADTDPTKPGNATYMGVASPVSRSEQSHGGLGRSRKQLMPPRAMTR